LQNTTGQRCSRAGIVRALNRHHVREFDLDRKPHHWEKRKLKRDE
jgi:hypothetical protein